MWRYVFFGESGTEPIDFKAAVRQLAADGLQPTVRSIVRGLRERAMVLSELLAEVDALLGGMGVAPVMTEQP
jgi:hypothetical protein